MDEDSASDPSLLRAHIEGDPHAFAHLIRRYQSRLWLAARCVTGNHEDAKDAMQEGLIRAYRRAFTWRGEGTVASWLHQIVTRAALDQVVKQAKRHTYSLDDVPPTFTATTTTAADPVEMQVVAAVVAALPLDQRECFVRIDLLGFTFAEVAGDLGIPEGTVKSRRARGKAQVVRALSEAGLVGPHRARPAASVADPEAVPRARQPLAPETGSPPPSPEPAGEPGAESPTVRR